MTPLLAAEAAEDTPGLVDPVVGLMIWTLVVFALTLFVLWKVAFPRIGEALDKRQRMIEDSIDSAEKTRSEADALLREYRERLSDARGQADEIVAQGKLPAASAPLTGCKVCGLAAISSN